MKFFSSVSVVVDVNSCHHSCCRVFLVRISLFSNGFSLKFSLKWLIDESSPGSFDLMHVQLNKM